MTLNFAHLAINYRIHILVNLSLTLLVVQTAIIYIFLIRYSLKIIKCKCFNSFNIKVELENNISLGTAFIEYQLRIVFKIVVYKSKFK